MAAAAELTEARAQADRERRTSSRLRHLLVGTAALLVLALVAGAVAVQQRGAADDQRSIARAEARVAAARELSSAAIANLEADPELSALLALEARARLGAGEPAVAHEIEETLHRAAYALRIEQRLPGVGGAVAWSPDGEALAVQGPAGSGVRRGPRCHDRGAPEPVPDGGWGRHRRRLQRRRIHARHHWH